MIALVPDSYGAPVREFNPCHDKDDGKFCSDEGPPSGPVEGGWEFVRTAKGGVYRARVEDGAYALDPPVRYGPDDPKSDDGPSELPSDPRWVARMRAELEAGPAHIIENEVRYNRDGTFTGMGELKLGRQITEPLSVTDYKVPDTSAHKVVRDDGWWGSSHGTSSMMAGTAASIMGVDGYRATTSPDKALVNRVEKFLTAISEDSVGAEERLYHGFQNVKKTVFKSGDTLKLPLTAAAGRKDTISYGIRLDRGDQEGEPTLFEFPIGTPMVAYGKWKPGDAQGFKYVYSEAIVAGEYRVTGVKRVQFAHGQHDRANKKHYSTTTGRIVTLEPIGIFDMATRTWRKHRA